MKKSKTTKKTATFTKKKLTNQKKLETVVALRNCYFGGKFYRCGENYAMDKPFAEMAAKTNKFNLV